MGRISGVIFGATVFFIAATSGARADAQTKTCRYTEDYKLVCTTGGAAASRGRDILNGADPIAQRRIEDRGVAYRKGGERRLKKEWRPYTVLRGGYVFDAASKSDGSPDGDLGEGPLFAAALGADLGGLNTGDLFRAEAELVWAQPQEEVCALGACVEFTETVWALLAGIYLQPTIAQRFKPFVGVAAGPAYIVNEVRIDGLGAVDEGEFGWAYSGRAGLGYRLSEDVEIELGYRYLGTTEIEDVRFDNQSAEIGVRYDF